MIPPRRSWAQIGCWNVGTAGVIGGTVAGVPLAVDVGSALLVIALAIAFHAARPSAGTTAGGMSALVGHAYWVLLLVLAVSIPVGAALAHLRHS